MSRLVGGKSVRKVTPLFRPVTVYYRPAKESSLPYVQVKIAPQESLLKSALDQQVPITSVCNGSLNCGGCHVILDSNDQARELPKPSEEELDLLCTQWHFSDSSRLACQIPVTADLDGLHFTIPGNEPPSNF